MIKILVKIHTYNVADKYKIYYIGVQYILPMDDKGFDCHIVVLWLAQQLGPYCERRIFHLPCNQMDMVRILRNPK